jgi:hypothetical protein
MTKMTKATVGRMVQKDARVDGILNSSGALRTREEFIFELRTQWEDAKQRFLVIGRRLSEAYRTLGSEVYEDMITNDLPFTMPIAHQLRAVAEAVMAGRLEELELPSSYATAYQLTTLNSDEMALARQRHLVHPKVRRKDVEEFKRQIRFPATNDEKRRSRHLRRLLGEEQRLMNRLREIQAEVARIKSGAPLPSENEIDTGSGEFHGTIIEGTVQTVADAN